MAIGGNHGRLMSEINVTPFVDVMLVLLVIFMVTAPMMTQGINVDLPKEKMGPLPPVEKQIIVTIDKKGDVYINRDSVKLGLLKETLEHKLMGRSDPSVYLRADQEIPYGMVVRVMSQIKAANIVKIGMVTAPVDIESGKTGETGR